MRCNIRKHNVLQKSCIGRKYYKKLKHFLLIQTHKCIVSGNVWCIRLWCYILFIWNKPRTNVSNTSGNAKHGGRVKEWRSVVGYFSRDIMEGERRCNRQAVRRAAGRAQCRRGFEIFWQMRLCQRQKPYQNNVKHKDEMTNHLIIF